MKYLNIETGQTKRQEAPMIQGEHVILRKMEIEDTDDIVRWRNSEGVRTRFIYQELFTRESHLNWIKTMVDTGKVVQMIIVEKDTGRAIGSAFIRDIDHKHHKGEYGLFIGEDVARGKGIGREVTHLMLEYGLSELGLHRIYSRVLEDNEVSIRSALKGGLEREGLAIDDVCIDGVYHNVVMLGKVRK